MLKAGAQGQKCGSAIGPGLDSRSANSSSSRIAFQCLPLENAAGLHARVLSGLHTCRNAQNTQKYTWGSLSRTGSSRPSSNLTVAVLDMLIIVLQHAAGLVVRVALCSLFLHSVLVQFSWTAPPSMLVPSQALCTALA